MFGHSDQARLSIDSNLRLHRKVVPIAPLVLCIDGSRTTVVLGQSRSGNLRRVNRCSDLEQKPLGLERSVDFYQDYLGMTDCLEKRPKQQDRRFIRQA